MNHKSAIACSLVLSFVIASAAIAAPPVLTPGRWEVTMKVELPNGTPTMTNEICITRDKAEHPEPPASKPNDDCQITGGMSGNLLKYQVKCGKKKSTTTAEFTYSGDQYEGVVTIKTDEFEIRQIHTARRIGECESGNQ